MITKKQVLNAIGCDKLDLIQGDGYLYFSYDSVLENLFETESVYVARLNHLQFEKWVNIGKDFVARIEQRN